MSFEFCELLGGLGVPQSDGAVSSAAGHTTTVRRETHRPDGATMCLNQLRHEGQQAGLVASGQAAQPRRVEDQAVRRRSVGGVRLVRAVQPGGLSEVAAAQRGDVQGALDQRGLSKVGSLPMDPLERCVFQRGVVEPRVRQRGSGQVGVDEPDVCQAGSGQVGLGEIGPTQILAGQIHALQPGFRRSHAAFQTRPA